MTLLFQLSKISKNFRALILRKRLDVFPDRIQPAFIDIIIDISDLILIHACLIKVYKL